LFATRRLRRSFAVEQDLTKQNVDPTTWLIVTG
jgi:hypothetical protein